MRSLRKIWSIKFLVFTFPVHELRKSSLSVIYDLNKLALIPRGGSTVILLPFCKIITGNCGLGILVNHNRKSLCTWNMRKAFSYFFYIILSSERWKDYSNDFSFITRLTDQMTNDLLTKVKMWEKECEKNDEWLVPKMKNIHDRDQLVRPIFLMLASKMVINGNFERIPIDLFPSPLASLIQLLDPRTTNLYVKIFVLDFYLSLTEWYRIKTFREFHFLSKFIQISCRICTNR